MNRLSRFAARNITNFFEPQARFAALLKVFAGFQNFNFLYVTDAANSIFRKWRKLRVLAKITRPDLSESWGEFQNRGIAVTDHSVRRRCERVANAKLTPARFGGVR